MGLAEIIQDFVLIAKAAGEIPMQHYGNIFDLGKLIPGPKYNDEKDSTKDSLTIVDLETQKFILSELLPKYSYMGIYSEESDPEIIDLESKFRHTGELVGNEFTIVIDSLDGTTNYLNTNPNNWGKKGNPNNRDRFGVQITLLYGSEIVGGVVHFPALHKTISTYQSGPTLLNDEIVRLVPREFSPNNPARISSSVTQGHLGRELSTLRNYFPNHLSFDASCYYLLALLTQEMDAYALATVELLDFGCTALAYENAGGFCGDIRSERVNVSNLIVPCERGLELRGFMILAPNKKYHTEMLQYIHSK